MSNPRPVPMRRSHIISVKVAAFEGRQGSRTIQSWCKRFGIGRRPAGGGPWEISAPALDMLLDGQFETLEKLRSGNFTDPDVEYYFLRRNMLPGYAHDDTSRHSTAHQVAR